MRSILAKFLSLLLLVVGCSGGEVDFARSLAVPQPADLVLRHGKIITVDREFSIKEAVAIKGGRFIVVGSDRDVRPTMGPTTRVIDLGGRTVIPGLIDSHIHATVAGLNWNGEIHLEQTRTLADALGMIAAATKSRPAGSWVVVAGGWVPTQFAERRFPSRAELDQIAPNHPVYVQYLRQGALLNGAALKSLGISNQTAEPQGGKFERDPRSGELTGWFQGVAGWEYAYSKIPHLTMEQVRQSLLDCFHQLNRFGLTSVVDVQTTGVTFAHRRLLADMSRTGELTLRINFIVAPNDAGDELDQLKLAGEQLKQLQQNDWFRFAGFGETLIRGIGDGDVLANPKGVTISAEAKEKFRRMARFFAETGYSFHLHTTQDNTARQLLDVLEQVNAATPFARQRIAFAHLEDATAETLARIKTLGAGVSVQDRLVLTGERNAELWGLTKARQAPPLRSMIQSGVRLGAGTDAFRSANYSPMLSLWWLITGKTVAGTAIRDPSQNVSREEALRMYTIGGAWFSSDEGHKGSIEVGKFADLVVLNADYLTVPEDQIRSLESLMTIVGGRVVYSAGPFASMGRN
ncbi:MAG TPA: amidohydrolase [Candidatus Binatia bacterium]